MKTSYQKYALCIMRKQLHYFYRFTVDKCCIKIKIVVKV